jgi:hypothetical protein
LHAQGQARLGLRASPVVSLGGGDHHVTVAMKSFWQNFPKALETSSNALVLRLLPPQYPDVHEIQGGEQKTHEFAIAFGRDSVTTDPLAWYRTPLLACATPDWYCTTGVVPGLTPSAVDPNRDYLQLVAAALDGEDTLLQKREKIDEYGWRHFGDLYADHEAVHSGDEPLVSHYNNQYDAIGGFAYQFLRTGDPRWWRHMEELADHVVDIDIYHTHVDKSAYAQGLFWHTCHYADASLATHRSYPRKGGAGGGPSAEHNYTTGLMLHYFLSGSLLSRDSVIGLAQWVLDMDDGRKSIFRFLDRGDTGLANALYQGPSRGAGHSVNALLDGHRLTGNSQFLAKADQLIRRCSHPDDDIVSRNLLDAERRWSYTAFLQGLGKYLDYKAERGTVDQMYAYARLCLLRYAEWMVTNEYPYLERPEILEHPTETWAAQDMRKSEVFKYAAQHASDEERDVFLERSEFFFRYSTSTLLSMKTRTLVRPIVLMLSNGYRHAWFQRQAAALAPLPVPVDEGPAFGPPEAFVPQKVRALKRARIIAAVLAAVVAMLAALGLTLWTV